MFVRRFHLFSKALFNFHSESIDAHVVNRVLETIVREVQQNKLPSMFSVSTISIVSLHEHNRFNNFGDLFWRTEAEQLAQASIRLLAPMGHSHAPSDQNIEASQALRFTVLNRNKPDVMSINIGVVDRRYRNSDLEPIDTLAKRKQYLTFWEDM
jgi:hypothetical protein